MIEEQTFDGFCVKINLNGKSFINVVTVWGDIQRIACLKDNENMKDNENIDSINWTVTLLNNFINLNFKVYFT